MIFLIEYDRKAGKLLGIAQQGPHFVDRRADIDGDGTLHAEGAGAFASSGTGHDWIHSS